MLFKKFFISFEYEGFTNKAVVTPFAAERKAGLNYIVEIYTREYIVWKTETGWRDLNGVSNGLLMSIGNAIDLHYQQIGQQDIPPSADPQIIQ